MKKLTLITMVALVLSIFTAVSALAGVVLDRIIQKGELVVGTSGNQLPFSMTTKDGKIIGLDADLATIMASSMGVKVKFDVMPFSELLTALEEGKVDMVLSSMTILPKRNLKVAFVGPYFVSGKSIITPVEKAESLNTVADLNSPEVTLVALKGSTSQIFVEKVAPKAKLITTEDYDKALDMVMQDKADAMVADYPYCAVSSYRYPEKKLATADKPFTYEPLGIALPANDPLLINWVENFLMTLNGSNGLKVVTERWFKNPAWLSELP
ncbi:MAG: transporter substrate-binding domain-containing protein [Desulfobulbaceae bacterium]|nr:transporter substrate-binding domain-containing protein [Desulfobulbaceae bacterium]